MQLLLVVLLVCTLASITHAQYWTVTGNLTNGRDYHTATLLPNGNVLVAGGYDGGFLYSAELYNATTGIWTVTGSLNTGRDHHTATLLPNGNVLVVAGDYYGYTEILNSAEFYNATTGVWTVTGSLTYARLDHTATLLTNGNVLVAGGTNIGPIGLNSAELYNATTGVWTLAGNLTTTRYLHTATLLPNGNVLVAAGTEDGYDYLNSAELYNATTGLWTVTGSLAYAREVHTATLLTNGNVLVAGGVGGFEYSLNTVELYNATTGVWTLTGNLTYARNLHTATLLPNGNVLAAAGTGNGYDYFNSAELYNVTTGLWTVTGSLTYARYAHTATLLPNENVLVAGGWNGGGFNSAELYNATSTTATTTPTPTSTSINPAATASIPTIPATATPAPTTPVQTSGSTAPTNTPTGTATSTPTPTSTSPVTIVCSSLQSGATTGFGFFNVTSAATTAIGFCSAGSTGSPTLYCGVDGSWNFNSLSGSCVTIYSSSNVGAIVGGILGGLVGLVLLALLLWFLRSRYWSKKDVNISDYTKTVIPISSSKPQQSVSQVSAGQSDDIYIAFNSLKLGTVLGQGHFGQVYQAEYTGAQVAVKKSKGIDEKLILEEATMMKNLPPHPNVVQYYGVSQENGEFMMVTELCDKGNLAQYLRNPNNNLTSQQYRQFCRQIASGMWHISKYGIIHRDLRAENILLSSTDTKLVAKVADFGLARSLQRRDKTLDSAYYRMTEMKDIPVAWTPPEVLNLKDQLKYVAASDVWSFGIVIWEIYSAGAKPFDGMDLQLVATFIRDQNRTTSPLPRPNNCPDDIFTIMNSCWAFNPQDRPTFEQLYNQFS